MIADQALALGRQRELKGGLHAPTPGVFDPRSHDIRIVRLPVEAEPAAADDPVPALLAVLAPAFGDEMETGVRLRRAGAREHIGEHVDVTRAAETGHAPAQLSEDLKAGRHVLCRRQRLEAARRDEIEISPGGDAR